MSLIRLLDILLSVTGLMLTFPFLVILFVIGLFDTVSPIFRQVRLGRDQRPFVLLKLRTMRVGSASVPSHLSRSSEITRLGAFLRRSKLDELPQLWNVLIGDMSLVGPRPGLPSHLELVEARATRGVFSARPGITGLAQVNGIDMSTPELLAETDAQMLADFGVRSYVKFILFTIMGKGGGDAIRS